jgi:hypothetical protein
MKSDIVNPFPDTENVSLQKRPGLALESIHSFWGPVPWRPGCVAIGVWREPGRWLLLCEGAFAAEWLVKTGPSPLFFLRLCGVSRCFKGTVYIHTFCHISVGGNIFCSGKSTCFFVGYLKATRSTVRSLKPWKGAKSPEADWDGTATQCFPFSWHPRKRMTIPSEWYIYIYIIHSTWPPGFFQQIRWCWQGGMIVSATWRLWWRHVQSCAGHLKSKHAQIQNSWN